MKLKEKLGGLDYFLVDIMLKIGFKVKILHALRHFNELTVLLNRLQHELKVPSITDHQKLKAGQL